VRTLDRFHLFRYEDVIWSKRQWCADIAKYLDIDLPSETLSKIADGHDVRPEQERPERHIRQVSPGNHKKHLNEEAIRHIELRCRPIFELFEFDYAVS
jgi:hypothetical protein